MSVFSLPFTFSMVMPDIWALFVPVCPIVPYMQTVSVTTAVATNMAIRIDGYCYKTPHESVDCQVAFKSSASFDAGVNRPSILCAISDRSDQCYPVLCFRNIPEYRRSVMGTSSVLAWRLHTFHTYANIHIVTAILALTYGIVCPVFKY